MFCFHMEFNFIWCFLPFSIGDDCRCAVESNSSLFWKLIGDSRRWSPLDQFKIATRHQKRKTSPQRWIFQRARLNVRVGLLAARLQLSELSRCFNQILHTESIELFGYYVKRVGSLFANGLTGLGQLVFPCNRANWVNSVFTHYRRMSFNSQQSSLYNH